MILHETYCSVHFLELLYSQLNSFNEEYDGDSSEPEHLLNLKKLIHRYSDLIIDIPAQEILDRSLNKNHPMYNPSLKKLWKEGRQHFFSIPETFEQMKTDQDYFKGKTTELYFLKEQDKFCSDVGNKNGIHCFNYSQIPQKIESLFELVVLKTDIKKFYPIWDAFKDICPPSNSLIIVDQFLKTEFQSLTLNLFPLLKGILPAELSISYHIAIIISEESDQNLPSMYEEISNFINYNYSYEFELTILQTRKKLIHDRNILTNNCWISSGYGFDLVREKNDKLYFRNNTTIHFFPITSFQREFSSVERKMSKGTILTDWRELTKFYSTIFNNTAPKTDKIINVVGSGIHRLLK